MVSGAILFLAPQIDATSISGTTQLWLRVFFSALPFLVPAYAAFALGRLWQSWVFFLMACISATNLYCAADGASPAVQSLAAVLDEGWSYLCLLQIAFMVAGPEDPHMQWIDHPLVHTKQSQIAAKPPLDVIIMSRAVPVVGMAILLGLYSSSAKIYWPMHILCVSAFCLACTTFWLHHDRRLSVQKVLIRKGFWVRFLKNMLLPMAAMIGVFYIAEAKHFEPAALWHAFVASLAYGATRSVWRDGTQRDDVVGTTPHNPLVVRGLLALPAVLGSLTLVLASATDWAYSERHWQWHSITVAGLAPPASYVLICGAFPTLTALAAAFWLVKSTGDPWSSCGKPAMGHQEGCSLGCIASLQCLISLIHAAMGWPQMARCGFAAALVLLAAGTVLTTASVPQPQLPSLAQAVRLPFAIVGAFTVVIFLSCLIVSHGQLTVAGQFPQPLMAAMESAALVPPLLWPMTWSAEVESRWKVHMGYSNTWATFSPS